MNIDPTNKPENNIDKYWDLGIKNLEWLEQYKAGLEASRDKINADIAAALENIEKQKEVLQGYLKEVDMPVPNVVALAPEAPVEEVTGSSLGVSPAELVTQHYTDVQGVVHSDADSAIQANQAYIGDSRS